MQQRLADNGAHTRIIMPLAHSLGKGTTQLVAPATARRGASSPASDLPSVIVRATATEETAVPMEPSPRVLCVDPTFTLPLALPKTALDAVAIGWHVVLATRVHGCWHTFKPLRRKFFVSHCDGAPENAGLASAGVEVAAPKDAPADRLSRRQRRQEFGCVCEVQLAILTLDAIVRCNREWRRRVGWILQESVPCAIVRCWGIDWYSPCAMINNLKALSSSSSDCRCSSGSTPLVRSVDRSSSVVTARRGTLAHTGEGT